MLTVEKIGGTSMSAMQEVINNVILFKSGQDKSSRRTCCGRHQHTKRWLFVPQNKYPIHRFPGRLPEHDSGTEHEYE